MPWLNRETGKFKKMLQGGLIGKTSFSWISWKIVHPCLKLFTKSSAIFN